MKTLLALAVLAVAGCGSANPRDTDRIEAMYDRVRLLRSEMETAFPRKDAALLDAVEKEMSRYANRDYRVFVRDLSQEALTKRELAAFALAFAEGDAAVAARLALLDALNDRDQYLRATAIVAIGRLHLPDTEMEPFRRLMKAPEPHVRQGALYGLRSQLDEGQDGGMRKEVEDMLEREKKEWEIRTEAVIVLRRMRSKQSLPKLAEALKDPDSHVRAQAAAAFGLFGDDAREYAPLLIETLKDPQTNVVECADASLTRLYNENFYRVYDKWRVWYEDEERKHVYVCPDHPQEQRDKPGQCPIDKCKRKLERQLRPDQYACPDHPEVQLSHPGKCSRCQKELVPVKKGK